MLPSRLHVLQSHGGLREGRERGPGACRRWAETGVNAGFPVPVPGAISVASAGEDGAMAARPSWPFVGSTVGRAGRVWWLMSAGVGLEIVNNPPAVTPPPLSGFAEL